MVYIEGLTVEQLISLSAVSFFAGVLNAISGGGGMILIPSMMVCGVPPINAITVNKFQNALGSLAAIRHYFQHGLFEKKGRNRATLFLVSFFSLIGAVSLDFASSKALLSVVIPYILIFVSVYSVMPQTWFEKYTKRTVSTFKKNAVWSFMGAYGGAVSIGTGPLMIAAHRILNVSSVRSAIAETKPMMLVINTTSLLLLVLFGHLWWKLGLLLAFGNMLGAWLGARITTGRYLIIAKWVVFILPLVIAVRMLLEG
ncbi:sulfite exporter TauE/SafE family protein [Marinomonas mediterranea]|jgi:Predicted permeases|uniref:Probable membrane transporter protein n=1 Tax=Marinomonas mediterranea (strain ATCC 700492 / JCM 21426 / NBRC 103028 / MMB-1) TaxID=717774 RepID=F2JW52_MARM1|nr:sulfite exporter TauE/SafE family protein [Marinomonas mediterranea]ADZ89440.1 protein of unknown function DUF81 [Marinomonas mediterranea MMB-1]WCN15693.1 TSUP family transporter [Marinomonas mediterranea MMB-1]